MLWKKRFAALEALITEKENALAALGKSAPERPSMDDTGNLYGTRIKLLEQHLEKLSALVAATSPQATSAISQAAARPLATAKPTGPIGNTLHALKALGSIFKPTAHATAGTSPGTPSLPVSANAPTPSAATSLPAKAALPSASPLSAKLPAKALGNEPAPTVSTAPATAENAAQIALLNEYDALAWEEERRAFWRKNRAALDACEPLKNSLVRSHIAVGHEFTGGARVAFVKMLQTLQAGSTKAGTQPALSSATAIHPDANVPMPNAAFIALLQEYNGLAWEEERRAFARKNKEALNACEPLKGTSLRNHIFVRTRTRRARTE